ncbi:MAG: ATP-binding protein [Chitinophagaceae bacterium]|nr:ATP-binding protein [Chitinophagaceae bacterium]
MPNGEDKKIKKPVFLFWLLFVYIVAAIIWWFISLEKQNRQITELRQQNILLQYQNNSLSQPVSEIKKKEAEKIQKRNTVKYITEGIVFLFIILAGAYFILRAVRNELQLQHQQQNFLMAVTHELKTPLSVMRLNLETLIKHTLEPEKTKKLLKATLSETGRLNFLINNVLIASRLEGSQYEWSREELDFSELLKDCVKEFRSRYPEQQIEEEIATDCDLKGDALLLQILASNLMENAVKYSGGKGVISIKLHRHNGQILLKVSDQGPGIPDHEKVKIFQRFYRIGNENTRQHQGTGLGLYLCKKIANYHHAQIQVTDNQPAGSTFVVTFKT